MIVELLLSMKVVIRQTVRFLALLLLVEIHHILIHGMIRDKIWLERI
jgi:hypothetical protein